MFKLCIYARSTFNLIVFLKVWISIDAYTILLSAFTIILVRTERECLRFLEQRNIYLYLTHTKNLNLQYGGNWKFCFKSIEKKKLWCICKLLLCFWNDIFSQWNVFSMECPVFDMSTDKMSIFKMYSYPKHSSIEINEFFTSNSKSFKYFD